MENMKKIHDKHKEMHPMGYHVEAAHTELLRYMGSSNFKDLPHEEQVDKITSTMMNHYNDFHDTVRDHPVHSDLDYAENGKVFHNEIQRMFRSTQNEAVDVEFGVKKPVVSGGNSATFTTIKNKIKDKAKKKLGEMK